MPVKTKKQLEEEEHYIKSKVEGKPPYAMKHEETHKCKLNLAYSKSYPSRCYGVHVPANHKVWVACCSLFPLSSICSVC